MAGNDCMRAAASRVRPVGCCGLAGRCDGGRRGRKCFSPLRNEANAAAGQGLRQVAACKVDAAAGRGCRGEGRGVQ